MKYRNLGAFKNVQNMPYCKAAVDLKVGMGVVLDRVAKTANLPASADEAKAAVYIVSNIDDVPERISTQEAFTVEKGRYVRADDLRSVNGQEIEFAGFETKDGTSNLSVGDSLVFGTDGLLAKATAVTGYAVSFKIIAKTSYMDDGLLCEIIAA